MPADPGSNRRVIGQLAGQAAIGASVGLALLGGLFATDAVGLRTLLRGADGGELALLLMALQFGGGFATFAVVTALALGPVPAARRRWSLHRRPDAARPAWRQRGGW